MAFTTTLKAALVAANKPEFLACPHGSVHRIGSVFAPSEKDEAPTFVIESENEEHQWTFDATQEISVDADGDAVIVDVEGGQFQIPLQVRRPLAVQDLAAPQS